MELRAVDLTDRRTQYVAGGCAVLLLTLAAAYSVGTGQYELTAVLLGLALAPVIFYAALRWPYVAPYGLYVVLIPFEQLLVIPGAGTLARFAGLAAIAAVLVHAMRSRRISRPSVALYFWAAYLLWVLIRLVGAPDLDNAAITAQQLVSTIILFAVLSLSPITEREFRAVCAIIVLGGVFSSLDGMYTYNHFPPINSEGRLSITTSTGGSLDPNGYADALLAPFALALVSLLNARKPWLISISLFSVLAIAMAIGLSLSREALLACLVIVLVTIWFSRRRIIGLLLAVPCVALLPTLIPALSDRAATAAATGGAGRTSIWKVDLHAFLQHPFAGWGTGGSIEAYDTNYLAVFQPYNAGWSRPPHDTPLMIAVEWGVIGLVLFFAACFAAYGPLSKIKRGDSLFDLRVGVTAALTGGLFVSFFVDVAGHKDFWLILGAAAQLRTVQRLRAPAAAPAVSYEPPGYEVARAGSARGAWRRRPPRFRNGTSMKRRESAASP